MSLSKYSAQLVLSLLFVPLALGTVVTHLSRLLGLSYISYVNIISVVLLLAVPATLLYFNKRYLLINRYDKLVTALLAFLGILTALVAVYSFRPAGDDYYYIPNTVYYLENPTAPLGDEIHFIDTGGKNFQSLTWGTSVSYDYLRSIPSYVSDISFLTTYYILSVAVAGFALPLALYLLFSLFSKKGLHILVAIGLTIGVTLLLGETHRSLGNFYLTRIFQGKVVLTAIVIPLFTYYSLLYLKGGERFYLLQLFLISTAAAGMSSTSIILLVPLALIFSIANGLSTKYLLNFSYLLLFSLFLLLNSSLDITNPDSPVNRNFPSTFGGQIELFINPQQPISLIVIVVTTVTALLLTKGKKRKLLILWILVFFGLYFNPIVWELFYKSFIGPNIYWRLIFVFPFPLVLAISVLELLKKFNKTEKQLSIAMGLAALLVVAHFVIPTTVYKTDSIFGIPDIKLPQEETAIAREIVSRVSPGPMLAPPPISSLIPLITSKSPQIRSRALVEDIWWEHINEAAEGKLRLEAFRYLAGQNDKFASFKEVVIYNKITSIVAHESLEDDTAFLKFLEDSGYKYTGKAQHYILFEQM